VRQIAADHQNDDWRFGMTDPRYLSAQPYRTVIFPEAMNRRAKWVGGVQEFSGPAYGVSAPIDYMLRYAYFKPEFPEDNYMFSRVRTILNTELPTNRYDFFSNWPKGAKEALQAEIKKQFGFIGEVKPIETNALLLEIKDSSVTGLQPRAPYVQPDFGFRSQDGKMSANYMTMDDLANKLEVTMAIPVIDQTGLTTNRFDFTISWNVDDPSNLINLNEALTEQLGLELVPTNVPVQMLVVAKAN
jgi:hypothetical protein